MIVIDVLQGLLTPVIAIVVAYIAVMQHFLDKKKFRLALYDKRFKVYEQTHTFLSRIVQHVAATDEHVSDFLNGRSEAFFLFDDDISNLLEEILKKSCELRAIAETHISLKGEKRTEATEKELDLWGIVETHGPLKGEKRMATKKERELFAWFLVQTGVTTLKFGKYLNFKEV